MLDKILFGCRPRRAGRKANSNRGRSFCASTAPRRWTAGASCQADFAEFPIAPTRALSRWAMASNLRMSGCSLKIRSRSRAFSPLQKAHALLVFWETFRVAPRIAFSGSAATSKELKRRCASYVVSARGQSIRTPRCDSAVSRLID